MLFSGTKAGKNPKEFNPSSKALTFSAGLWRAAFHLWASWGPQNFPQKQISARNARLLTGGRRLHTFFQQLRGLAHQL